MISRHAVYRKTAKGSEAIAARQHGLSPKLRSLLILVDGKRNFEELARVASALGDAEQLLADLLATGCIEPVAAAPVSAPAPLAAPVRPAPAISLTQAQRYAVRRLTDILGPNADEVCLRIEASRTMTDFTAALSRAEGLVRQFRGSNAALGFAEDMQAHLPAA